MCSKTTSVQELYHLCMFCFLPVKFQRISIEPGIILIKGMKTKKYLAIDKTGKTIATVCSICRTSEECAFVNTIWFEICIKYSH